MKIITTLLRILLKPFFGRSYMQFFFKEIYSFGLRGMNYGWGTSVKDSGEIKVMDRILSQNQKDANLIFFDVGANIGTYSKMLIEKSKDRNYRIYAFEPSLRTFNTLTQNIKNPKCILNNFGFSNENNEVNLYTNEDLSGLASVYQRNLDFIDIKMDKIEKISVKKMDDYCIENNISEITFLKIDVEGNELSVLNGAKKLLSENKIKYIQFEFGGCNIDSRTYFKDFYDLLNEKYKVYRILRDGLFHIEKYSENLEIFVTSNFFAELK